MRWVLPLAFLAACSSTGDSPAEDTDAETESASEADAGSDAGGTSGSGGTTDGGSDVGSGGDSSTGASTSAGTDGETGTTEPGLDERPPNPNCVAPESFPDLLSETGCVDPNDPTSVVAGVIPYEVNHPFWSDGTDKFRWLAIPDGTTITVDDATGNWEFPVGTVLMKEFRSGGTRLETRLLVRRAGDWEGQGYAWDDSQTDAQLMSGMITVDGIDWEIPGSGDCMECHTGGAGVSLGTETGQMNRDTTYPSTGRTANQILTYDAIGLFSGPVDEPSSLEVLPPPDGPDPVEDRARAYIHANCSMCHRPGEEELFDGRYATPFSGQGLCGVVPEQGELGDPANLIITPGSAANSIIVLRMENLEGDRMPQLGTSVIDTAGVELLSEWIDGLASCP